MEMGIRVKPNKAEVFIGLLLSIIINIAGSYLYLELFSKVSVEESLALVQQQGLYGEVITLGAVPNVLFFFAFLRKKNEDRARGILLGVILVAITTLVLKFI